MSSQRIVMTAADHERLRDLMWLAGHPRNVLDAVAFQRLSRELARARVVPPGQVPPDVVTLNSVAHVRDKETGELMRVEVCWPDEVDPEAGRINVLAPLGMALLGARVGHHIEWPMPSGRRRLQVVAVVFQPERTGDVPDEAEAFGLELEAGAAR